jgi:hypothetical protein
MWSETGIVGAYLHREGREQGSDHPDGHADPNPSITFIRGVRNSCQRNRRPLKCLHLALVFGALHSRQSSPADPGIETAGAASNSR